MPNQEYTTCMRPYMTGKGKTKEERRFEMCVGSKICSGKAHNRDNAESICLQPKPDKPESTERSRPRKRKNCQKEMAEIASCIAPELDIDEDTLREALQQCACGKVKKKTRMEKAMEHISPEQMEALQTIAMITNEMGTRA